MPLTVYLGSTPVGTLADEGDGNYSFAYTSRIGAERAGEPVLSLSLPARPEPFGPMESRPFFEGLLPEDEIRRQLARDIRAGNSYGFFQALGRDTAGAVVILPDDEDMPPPAGSVRWLSEEELRDKVDNLPRHPLGTGGPGPRMRLSLAGLQHKLTLIQSGSGRWGLPEESAPSTHILKPQFEDLSFEDIVFNEHFCMRVAACFGLPVAATEIAHIGGRPVLVVERFDRSTDGRATVRLHQEDFCQALGLLPAFKYQDPSSGSGPTYAKSVRLLRDYSVRPAVDVQNFVRAAVLNYALGNADAHAKNFAMLYAEDGPQLAPFYDIASAAIYEEIEAEMAMSIGDEFNPERVDTSSWLDFAGDVGISAREFENQRLRSAERIVECVTRVADLARAEGWHRPVITEIVELCKRRAAAL